MAMLLVASLILLFVSLRYLHYSLMTDIKELYRENDRLKKEIEEVKKVLRSII